MKDWAYKIYNWMISNGYRMEVMDLEDIRCGDRVCHEGRFFRTTVICSVLQYAEEHLQRLHRHSFKGWKGSLAFGLLIS